MFRFFWNKGVELVGPDHYYDLIQREHMNQPVEIRMHDGTVHRGIVRNLDRTHVYIEPVDGVGGVGGVSGIEPGVYAWG